MQQKTIFIIVAILVVLIAGGAVWWFMRDSGSSNSNGNVNTVANANTANTNNQGTIPPKSEKPILVLAVEPNTGSIDGDAEVVIRSAGGFIEGAKVYFGDRQATNVVFVDETQLTVKTPTSQVGTYNVVVVNPDGKKGTLQQGFTYTDK